MLLSVSSQQLRTSGRLAKIFPVTPSATFLACGIFHPHINSPHFMFENREEKTPSSFNNSSNINSPGEITKAGEHREEMFIHAQEQPRKPTDEKTENKQNPPYPAHPPPPAANQPGLCVNQVQEPKLCPGIHPGVFAPQDRGTAGVPKQPCPAICSASAPLLAANGHSPSALGCSPSQIILFLSLRALHLSLLFSKGFILPPQRAGTLDLEHQVTSSLLTPIPRWQAVPSLTALNASTGKG